MTEPTRDPIVTCATCGAAMHLIVDEHTPDGPSFAVWRCPVDRSHAERPWNQGAPEAAAC